MSKIEKLEAEKKIKEFFNNPSSAKAEDNHAKKIKTLAMNHNIKLGSLRKKFCKKCYSVFDSGNSEIRINKGFKIVKCLKCGFVGRWKIKKD